MNKKEKFLGIVENGHLQLLQSENESVTPVRLTQILRQAAQTPESGEIDLTKYEGTTIMVEGYGIGGWIFESEIIDHAGPILGVVVQKLFRNSILK